MVHGLTQSQNLTTAKQALSAARKEHAAAQAAAALQLPGTDELLKVTGAKLETAHTAERKALQEYIDPFKVHYKW